MNLRRRRVWSAAVAALIVLSFPVCGGDDPDPDSPPAPTTSTTLSPEAEVEAAYLGYWEVADRLTTDPDPQSTDIARVAVDPARARLVESLVDFESAGQATRAGSLYAHEVSDVVVNGDEATVRDCGVDDSVLIDSASGQVLDEGVVTTLIEGVLVRERGVWLVKELNPIQSWEGVAPCEQP